MNVPNENTEFTPEQPSSGTSPLRSALLSADESRAVSVLFEQNGVSLPTGAVSELHRYFLALTELNTQLNLTRHTTWEMFVDRDLSDTVRMLSHIQQTQRLFDIGSGGGVPGIPLSILRSDLSVSLCDSVGKKCDALRKIVSRLPGNRITIRHGRAEEILKRERFQTITARGVAPLVRLLAWIRPGLRGQTQALLIKGPRWTEELEEAKSAGLLFGLNVAPVEQWSTPGRDGQSVLLKVSRASH